MIHQAIRTMLQGINNAVIPDANIFYGNRNQFASFPSVVYIISDHETLTIGQNPLKRCTVTIKSVDKVSTDALAISDAVENAFVVGTYDGVEFCSVLNKNTILEEPTSGLGEETNPFVATTTAQIYYKG